MIKETDILETPNESVDEVINSMVPSNGQMNSINDIQNMVDCLLNSLPKVNRNSWREEMENMIVPMQQNPTTFDINEGLALSQGYRDRLSEMLMYAQRDLKIRKRCLEMMFDAVNLISKASSADKRKGEATMRYPVMVLQVESSEIFMKEVEAILANMKSTADAISRQASVVNMQIQLGERRQGNSAGTDIVPQSGAEEITRKNSTKEINGNKELNWDNI